MRMLPILFVLALALSLVAAPLALAQSAGDEQYVDPFQAPETDQGGNDGGGGGGPTGGGDDDTGSLGHGQASAPSQTPDTVPSEATTEGSEVATSQGDGATLPVTGVRPEGPGLLGLALVAMGFALRRRADFG